MLISEYVLSEMNYNQNTPNAVGPDVIEIFNLSGITAASRTVIMYHSCEIYINVYLRTWT